MDLQLVMIDFLRTVGFGTGVVLAGLGVLGWRMPRRAKVNTRSFERD